MLDTQYRMHKDICRFPSEEFYHGKLKTGPNLNYPRSAFCHRGSDCCSIIFGHIEGKEQYLMISTEEGNENSRANLEEVEQVVSNPGEGAFAYRWGGKPLQEVQGSLSALITWCNSLPLGSEWRYVIVSTVRSCPRSEIDKRPVKSWQKKYLGFVTDANQVNVCITRAQEGLCIIGNSFLLESNLLWRRLLKHYKESRCYVVAGEVLVRRSSAAHR
uniref:DNA2/NAM7 helicase-like C-terminal domain-containing protein n=1 Tax=Sphenodon punctatus TaxID=8508 RepID=A0A8D0HH67_SPHPU